MMKSKMMASGGKAKMMASGGMPMVERNGKKIPAFAADGEGKMAGGGMTNDGQFDDDVKRVRSGLYMNKDEDKVYSRERGLGPGMAARRLEKRGVDIKGMAGNRANEEDLGSYKKGGMSKMMASGGMSKMMASGGMPKALKAHAAKPASKAHAGLKSGGMAKMMSSGGSASKRADGIAIKGKTKGKMMSKGGKAC